MKQQIDEILAPFPNAGCEFNGKFWEVWIGSHAGGRENGVSLAKELAERVRSGAVRPAKTKPVRVPPQPLTTPIAPATDYDAIIASLKAQLAEALAKAPEPVKIPVFLLDPVAVEVMEEPEIIEEPVQVGHMDEPEPIEIPTFLTPIPLESIPPELLNLVRENEPYGETQTRLWSLYLELNGKLMLGLATEEDGRLHTRLHGHLAWISKGAAEVVT
jgi:hypothetical protein